MMSESIYANNPSILVGPEAETPKTSSYLYAIYFIEAFLLLWGVQLSFQSRNTDSLNESRPLALTTLFIAFLVILIGPMQLFLVGSPDLRLLQFSFGTLCGTVFCVIIIFVPKIMRIKSNPNVTLSEIITSSKVTSEKIKNSSESAEKSHNHANKSIVKPLHQNSDLIYENDKVNKSSCWYLCLSKLFIRLRVNPRASRVHTQSNNMMPLKRTSVPVYIQEKMNVGQDIYISPYCNECQQNIKFIDKLYDLIGGLIEPKIKVEEKES